MPQQIGRLVNTIKHCCQVVIYSQELMKLWDTDIFVVAYPPLAAFFVYVCLYLIALLSWCSSIVVMCTFYGFHKFYQKAKLVINVNYFERKPDILRIWKNHWWQTTSFFNLSFNKIIGFLLNSNSMQLWRQFTGSQNSIHIPKMFLRMNLFSDDRNLL